MFTSYDLGLFDEDLDWLGTCRLLPTVNTTPSVRRGDAEQERRPAERSDGSRSVHRRMMTPGESFGTAQGWEIYLILYFETYFWENLAIGMATEQIDMDLSEASTLDFCCYHVIL